MKVNKKHFGLVLASLMALSFNSHFAQAAKRTTTAFSQAKAFAFKKVGKKYVKLPEIKPGPVVIKKTGIRIDRKNLYIGGYVVNTTNREIKSLKIYPTFADSSLNTSHVVNLLNHKISNLEPKETRRFVIMRKISDVKPLVTSNIPFEDNCILNCYELPM